MPSQHFHRQHQRGFTLVEIMVALAILALVAGLALPTYTDYVTRSRVPPALSALTAYATRLEQFYQDNGSYGAGGCGSGMTAPTAEKFTLSCALTNGGQGFTATATGESGSQVAGFSYTIDGQGNRRTTAHPKATGLPMTCWTIKGTSCDA